MNMLLGLGNEDGNFQRAISVLLSKVKRKIDLAYLFDIDELLQVCDNINDAWQIVTPLHGARVMRKI